ncbi:hypothetical protein ERS043866_02674, partial [Streptococcus pneumoniae]
MDAERAKEVAPQAKIAELEYEVQRLEKALEEIDESESEDYAKEGFRAPLQSKLDAKKAKLSKLEELSDKIDELDAEIAKLEDQLKAAEENNNVEDYFKEGLEKTIAAKKAELEKTEADLKKAVNEPEKPAEEPSQPEKPAEEAPAPEQPTEPTQPEKPAEQPQPAPAPQPEKTDDQQAEEDYARKSEEAYNRLTQQQPPKTEKPAPAPQPEQPAPAPKT